MNRARSRQRRRHAAGRLVRDRIAAGLARASLLAVATVAVACPSCGGDQTGAAAENDPGPTFGAELTVSVLGPGRVTARSGELDCPRRCFARVVLDDPSADGAPQGISLEAEATTGARFTGWQLEAMELGIRARGPAQCSPMKRATVTSAMAPTRSSVITLPFGETRGTPPPGREQECASVTTVPVAYAVTATFEDLSAPVDAGADAADPTVTVLFEPPPGPSSQAKEIGLSGGSVYWRFQLATGLSGIARGSIAGGPASVIVPADRLISLFDVDRHVAFQRSGALYVIEAGGTQPILLGGAPSCAALASDLDYVYCRASGASSSVVYSWPRTGAAQPTALHTLPRGFALAVDEQQQRLYVSDDPGSASAATIVSIPRAGDGGAPPMTTLVVSQTSPKNLVAGSSRLFWIDDRFSSSFVATSASKLFPQGAGLQGYAATTLPFLALEPGSSSAYWLGIGGSATGASQIVQITSSNTTTVFRSKLTGLGGLAVDGSFVYWTQRDGRVYRAPKNSLFP